MTCQVFIYFNSKLEPRFAHYKINKESVLDASTAEKCFLEEKFGLYILVLRSGCRKN